nr:MAG TPA: Vitamin D binding protein [Caudoviricetes sp.]
MKIKYFRNRLRQRMDRREKWASSCCPPKGID